MTSHGGSGVTAFMTGVRWRGPPVLSSHCRRVESTGVVYDVRGFQRVVRTWETAIA